MLPDNPDVLPVLNDSGDDQEGDADDADEGDSEATPSRAVAIGDALAAVMLAALLAQMGQAIADGISEYGANSGLLGASALVHPFWLALYEYAASWSNLASGILLLGGVGCVFVPRWLEGYQPEGGLSLRAQALTWALLAVSVLAVTSDVLWFVALFHIQFGWDTTGGLVASLLANALPAVLCLAALAIWWAPSTYSGDDEDDEELGPSEDALPMADLGHAPWAPPTPPPPAGEGAGGSGASTEGDR